jgi:hypothetical protein
MVSGHLEVLNNLNFSCSLDTCHSVHFVYKILIITPTNAQAVLLYTVRLHVSTFIGHHQGTKEEQKL